MFLGRGVIRAAEVMHRIHQCSHMIRVSELRYTMTQVEHMPATVPVGCQNLAYLRAYRGGLRKQGDGIKVPLQRHGCADARACQRPPKSMMGISIR